ncbi:MAG: MinD/ParA family protein [Bdellovibrionaceae bacterium]|nr:MinD/ParA family protein [Pseudobdellovibrionaceae bacterium]MBX3034377.1 MinD/ParA family protein [Pseudobdellovibrionaceae bacterium]
MKTKTMSITSGKGGVGKTTLVSNIALGLAAKGKKVLILDGDWGMANVDIFFGVRPSGHFLDVLKGQKTVREILCEVSPGIFLLPGGSGLPEVNGMNNFQRRALLDAVAELPHDFDWMLIDTAPGIADNVLYLNSAADSISVVITPDPASFADSYALIKVLHQKHKENRFSILCNQVRDEVDGFGLYRRFQEAVTRFLDVGLDFAGSVPMDPLLRRATQMQRLVLRQEPQSPSARAIANLCARIHMDEGRVEGKGSLQVFWQQVVGVA